jgi:serine protease Do
MRRARLLSCVLVLLAGTARAGEDRAIEVLRATEARVVEATRTAAPSVACIYVSRSDAYHRAPYWGTGPAPDLSGKLGRFDAAAARKRVPADAPHRARVLRAITDHDLSDPTCVPESYGSGFVLDRSGLILTNAHVVRNATRIYVRLSGKRASWADILACDPRSDLAVLKLLDPPAGLKALPLGDGGRVDRGKFVLSLVFPFTPRAREDGPRVTTGEVASFRHRYAGNTSEVDRSKYSLHQYGTLIKTDATTTPTCSGGALLDLDGKVIGLTTALASVPSESPGGFAIPFDDSTKQIIGVLERGEEVEYGFLGVQLQQGGPANGVRLFSIVPGSPAARAKLRSGDRVVRINGKDVREKDDLFLYVGIALAGSTARVEVERNGRPLTFAVKLAKCYVSGPVVAARRPEARFGLRVDYTSILCQRDPFLGWRRTPTEGVVIREVAPNSPADKASLQPDKVITRVNGKPVASPADYYQQIARAGRRVELTFLDSQGRPQHLVLAEK